MGGVDFLALLGALETRGALLLLGDLLPVDLERLVLQPMVGLESTCFTMATIRWQKPIRV